MSIFQMFPCRDCSNVYSRIGDDIKNIEVPLPEYDFYQKAFSDLRVGISVRCLSKVSTYYIQSNPLNVTFKGLAKFVKKCVTLSGSMIKNRVTITGVI